MQRVCVCEGFAVLSMGSTVSSNSNLSGDLAVYSVGVHVCIRSCRTPFPC